MIKINVKLASFAAKPGKDGDDPAIVVQFSTEEFNANALRLVPFLGKTGVLMFDPDQPELAGLNVTVGYKLPNLPKDDDA